MSPPSLDCKVRGPEPFCPLWTNITKRRTPCLKEGCTKYIPPEELENGETLEGLCSDIVTANCLGSISLSLAILAGQVEMKYKEEETSSPENKSEEPLYG